MENSELTQLVKLAQEQIELEAEVERCEAALGKANKNLKYLAETMIPETMNNLGLSEIGLEDGRKITIKSKVHANITKDNKSAAIAWLVDKKHEKIIKNTISVDFAKGEMKNSLKLIAMLDENGYDVATKESVHNSTLCAFVKEKLERGEDIPMELFGVYVRKISQIS
jgi:hypothetical protein